MIAAMEDLDQLIEAEPLAKEYAYLLGNLVKDSRYLLGAGEEEVLEDSLFGYEGGVEFFFWVFFFVFSGNALSGAVEVADEFGSLGGFADLFFVVFVGVLGVESKGCDVGVLVSVAYRHEVCHDALLQVEGGAAAFCAK